MMAVGFSPLTTSIHSSFGLSSHSHTAGELAELVVSGTDIVGSLANLCCAQFVLWLPCFSHLSIVAGLFSLSDGPGNATQARAAALREKDFTSSWHIIWHRWFVVAEGV